MKRLNGSKVTFFLCLTACPLPTPMEPEDTSSSSSGEDGLSFSSSPTSSSSSEETTTQDTGTTSLDPGDSSTGTLPCDEVIEGDFIVTDLDQINDISNVSKITGAFSVAPLLGTLPTLDCLKEVNSLNLAGGNDYTSLGGLTVANLIFLAGGENTVFPEFQVLEECDILYFKDEVGTTAPLFPALHTCNQLLLIDVDSPLETPKLSLVAQVVLNSSASPLFEGPPLLSSLTIMGNASNYASLQGGETDLISIQDFSGNSLPTISVRQSLNILNCPNLDSFATLTFGEVFPEDGPSTMDEDVGLGFHIENTGLFHLDDLMGINTITARGAILHNPNLVDVFGLVNDSIQLSYPLDPSVPSLQIIDAPQLCDFHAQGVADSMTVPTFIELAMLKTDCKPVN